MIKIQAAQRILAGKELVKHPFPNSEEQKILYHVTSKEFSKFQRPPQGVFFSTSPIKRHGSSITIPVYIDVHRYHPENEDVAEMIFNRQYDQVQSTFKSWIREGYDAFVYGDDGRGGRWIVVFNPKMKIKNAETGKLM